MIQSLKLDFAFDPAKLKSDLDLLPDESWIAHFNNRMYEGVWSGIALRGPAGATHPVQSLFANPGTTDWENTEVLDRCGYFAEVLSTLECPLLSVRLLRLAPGGFIKEHTDHRLGFEDGEVRLHVPILTNPELHFMLAGERMVLQPGELWYLNVNLPHSVENRGTTARIHLVIDCVVDDWLRSVFERCSEEKA